MKDDTCEHVNASSGTSATTGTRTVASDDTINGSNSNSNNYDQNHHDDDNIEDDDGLNDHGDNINHQDVGIKHTETDETDEFEQLLPPKPNYNHADDEDLDALMGIELNDLKRSKKNDTKSQSMKSNTKQQHQQQEQTSECKCCVRKYGNTIILNTAIYNKTNKKCCLIGPHYVGPIFTFALLLGASFYFTKKAFDDVGSGSGYTCIAFTILTTYYLCKIVFVDPGIVKYEEQLIRRKRTDDNDDNDSIAIATKETKDSEYETVLKGEEEGWSYCAICQIYQPPRTIHCSDCRVCVEEYDHHCPWMGTCIGKKNMGAFMGFNFSWLIYLIYCCVWVLALGPVIANKANVSGAIDSDGGKI